MLAALLDAAQLPPQVRDCACTHCMWREVLVLNPFPACAAGTGEAEAPKITPLFTSLPSWRDLAEPLSAHRLHSNVTTLHWVGGNAAGRGTGQQVLAIGTQDGAVHLVSARGAVLASSTPGASRGLPCVGIADSMEAPGA